MIFGGFPDDYDWRAHDKRKHAARAALDAKWKVLRDYLPAIQRLAHGLPTCPIDQFTLQTCAHIVMEEILRDVSEEAELHLRHRDRPEPPAEPPGAPAAPPDPGK